MRVQVSGFNQLRTKSDNKANKHSSWTVLLINFAGKSGGRQVATKQFRRMQGRRVIPRLDNNNVGGQR